jgi:hypothetical protein
MAVWGPEGTPRPVRTSAHRTLVVAGCSLPYLGGAERDHG